MEPAAASLPVMTHADRRIALLHRMALLCAALVLTITSLSAFMRLSKAGLGCQPWPQCYGQSLRELQQGGICLLYTSDAADERSSVDLGGRRIIKKKNTVDCARYS